MRTSFRYFGKVFREQGIYTKVVSGSDSNTTHAWLVLDDSILQKNIQRAEEATDYEEVNKMNRILEGYGYNKEINIYPYCDLDSILRGCTIIDITGSQSQFRLDSKYFNYNIPIYIGEMDDFHNLFDINSINEFRNDDKLDNIYRIVQQYL